MSVPKFFTIKDPTQFIEKLKVQLKPVYKKTRLIVLFGSVAKKTMNLYSDLDLLVVTSVNRKEMRKELDELLFDFLIDYEFYLYDLIILSEAEFSIRKTMGVVKTALEEGIILWKETRT